MIKRFLPLFGAFLLVSCGQTPEDPNDPRRMNQKACVWSYDTDTEVIGIFFDSNYDFIPKIQYINPVSLEGAQDSIDLLGYCDGDEV